MLAFDAALHMQPPDLEKGQIALRGENWPVLDVSPGRIPPFSLSFEEAERNLQALERMFCEPDGSFVWRDEENGASWQIDGNLFDRSGRLLFVEIRGTAPETSLNQLLAALGGGPFMFQLRSIGVYLDEAAFREFSKVSAEQ